LECKLNRIPFDHPGLTNFLPKLKSQLVVSEFDPLNPRSQIILTVLLDLGSNNMDFKPTIDAFINELKKSGKINDNFGPNLA